MCYFILAYYQLQCVHSICSLGMKSHVSLTRYNFFLLVDIFTNQLAFTISTAILLLLFVKKPHPHFCYLIQNGRNKQHYLISRSSFDIILHNNQCLIIGLIQSLCIECNNIEKGKRKCLKLLRKQEKLLMHLNWA